LPEVRALNAHSFSRNNRYRARRYLRMRGLCDEREQNNSASADNQEIVMEPTTLFVNGFALNLWDPHPGMLTLRLDTRTLAKTASQAKIGPATMHAASRHYSSALAGHAM
jgi:hypothetical protein